jgi:MFS family permease
VEYYGWGLISYAIGSILFILPTTLLFRKIGPSKWFAFFSVSWGLIACLSATVDTVGGFIVTKMLLGITQSGFVACIILYIVYFYTKEESSFRLAAIISVKSICN